MNLIVRRALRFAHILIALGLATGLQAQATAQPSISPSAAPPSTGLAWPNKPIKLIVPYAPGGFGDIRARQISVELARALGQQVVVENKAGAGGVIGTDMVSKAPPDGYTFGMGNLAPLAVNRSLMKALPYDPLRDLAPVVLVEISPLVLTVGPAIAAASVTDLVAAAKAKPGQLTFASSGIGGAHHLSGEMFKRLAAIEIQHLPYKGGAPAATDLLAGHVSMMFEMGYAALPSIKAGKIKALAVTSSRRLAQLPDVPTMAESGLPGFESYNWQGIIAPPGTPRPIIDRINREINQSLRQGSLREAIVSVGSQVAGGTPEQFAEFIRTEGDKWAKVVREAGIKAE